METRVLTFHEKEPYHYETRYGPTYYIEADYSPIAVRICAESAPDRDAKFDIYDDGTSIFADRGSHAQINLSSGVRTTTDADTRVVLCKGETLEESAEDFSGNVIEKGSVVYCKLIDSGDGKNFSIHLELEKLTEDDEDEE